MSSELGRRARKKLESRERICECAAALFTSRGYAATTMEEIGECADVSRSTVFNYFPRKEDLVLIWFDRRRAGIASLLAGSDNQPGDALSRLHRAFLALAHIFEDDPQTGQAMVRSWLQAGGPLLTPDSDTTRLFADAIRVGQEHGDIARDIDPDRAGQLLFDGYLGVLLRWVTAEDEQPDLEESLVAALDLVLRGIAPRASARR
jgi:AcrR family transcriptional regulator